ncbi:MAG: DedA family protein [Halorhodospira sp.]
MPELILQAVDLLGWIGLFLAMIVLAPEAVVPFLGYAVYQAEITALSALSATSLGATLGSTLIYVAVRAIGSERVRAWVERGSHWHLIREKDLAAMTATFQRFGGVIVFFGRWVPTVRSLVSIPAGLLPMPITPFVVLTLLGTTAWNALLLGAGYLTGSNWERLEAYLGTYGTAATTLVIAAALVFILLRLRERLLRQ